MDIIFCIGIQSGELKHGPLALVDETVPIIMIIMRDNVHTKCMNALQQVTARKGRPIIVCEKGDVVSHVINFLFDKSFVWVWLEGDKTSGIHS